MTKAKAHPINILLIYFFTILPLLLSPKLYFNLIYSIVPIFIFLYYGLDLKQLWVSFLASFLPSLSYFIMVLFFGQENLKTGNILNLKIQLFSLQLSIKVFEDYLIYAIAGSVRIFLLSLISFSTSFMIDVTNLFKFLMVKKLISFKYGFAFSIGLNSVSTMKNEVKRINFLMKVRKIKPFYKGFLPILVYGIRYSELAAISLLSRGFSEDRIVFKYEKIKKNEFLGFLLISILIFLMLVLRR